MFSSMLFAFFTRTLHNAQRGCVLSHQAFYPQFGLAFWAMHGYFVVSQQAGWLNVKWRVYALREGQQYVC